MNWKILSIVAALPCLYACAQRSPQSAGFCRGFLGSRQIDEISLFAPESYFYREDRHDGVEQAVIALSFGVDLDKGTRAFRVRGHLRDMPAPRYQTSHLLPSPEESGDYVDAWQILTPQGLSFVAGTLQLTGASRDLLKGVFFLHFLGGQNLTCTFTVARDYARDTDD